MKTVRRSRALQSLREAYGAYIAKSLRVGNTVYIEPDCLHEFAIKYGFLRTPLMVEFSRDSEDDTLEVSLPQPHDNS